MAALRTVRREIPGIDEAAPQGEREFTLAQQRDLGPETSWSVKDAMQPQPGRGGETPREREDSKGDVSLRTLGGSSMAAPPRPKTPTPMAGSTFSPGAAQPPSGVTPFNPMRGPSPVGMARSQGQMYGALGGLKGGGLGLPLDPISDQQSDPISTLMQLLQKGRG